MSSPCSKKDPCSPSRTNPKASESEVPCGRGATNELKSCSSEEEEGTTGMKTFDNKDHPSDCTCIDCLCFPKPTPKCECEGFCKCDPCNDPNKAKLRPCDCGIVCKCNYCEDPKKRKR